MSFSLFTVGSGSSGNACVVWRDGGESDSFCLLIDAGLPLKRIRGAMRDRGLDLDALTHVLLTHEHTDHVSGLDVLTRAAPQVAVHASRGTAAALRRVGVTTRATPVERGGAVNIGPLVARPIPISHDASEPVGWRLEYRSNGTLHVAAVITDLGHWDTTVAAALNDASAIVLESNHDPEMLRTGPYPAVLKKRVASKRGHLSNVQTRRLLGVVAGITHSSPPRVLLAHLSEVNNAPDVAIGTARDGFDNAQIAIDVAPRGEASEVIVTTGVDAHTAAPAFAPREQLRLPLR